MEKLEHVIWILTQWWRQQLAKSSLRWLSKLNAPRGQINSTAWCAVDCLFFCLCLHAWLPPSLSIYSHVCARRRERQRKQKDWLIIEDTHTWLLSLFILPLTYIEPPDPGSETNLLTLRLLSVCFFCVWEAHSRVISSLWVNLNTRRERRRRRKSTKRQRWELIWFSTLISLLMKSTTPVSTTEINCRSVC